MTSLVVLLQLLQHQLRHQQPRVHQQLQVQQQHLVHQQLQAQQQLLVLHQHLLQLVVQQQRQQVLAQQQHHHNMATTTGLYGYNKSDGTEKMIAIWCRAPVIYNDTLETWEKAPITVTVDQKWEFRTFLDYMFMVDGVDPNYSYDGSVWSTDTNLADSPKAYYIENYSVRLYLGNINYNDTDYPSRVWFSDLPKNDKITWGLETGSDLAQTADSAVVTSAGSVFKTRNIKVGDPFTITNGTNAGTYTVQAIDSNTQITLTEELTYTQTSKNFWVGSNWFDVETDDGDTIKGFGKNSNELLIFKRNSLHRYSSRGLELRQVKDAPGTTSRRSIVNLGDYTYYYYPSGIYRYGGGRSDLISNAMEDFIDGVAAANQDDVVAWKHNEKIVLFYLGDVTLRDGTSISDCVISYDTTSNIWSARSYDFSIAAATNWLKSNVPTIYVASGSYVYEIDTGTDFNGSAISFGLETKVYFPAGENTVIDFNKIRIYIENGLDIQVLYKLYYRPTGNQNQWINDKDWQPLQGSVRGDRAEFTFPANSRASGIALNFIESSTNESFLLEKFAFYFSNPSER